MAKYKPIASLKVSQFAKTDEDGNVSGQYYIEVDKRLESPYLLEPGMKLYLESPMEKFRFRQKCGYIEEKDLESEEAKAVEMEAWLKYHIKAPFDG
jgi:hypothetical protein